ncbi:SGNH/GDSL hydrolase family protein [Psychroflexus sp. ALD_RP9]|uniref:SGNH/GDSL hydrolase family protein n=1 Tax=Psychroflexus sp. ALD_RP9 TaxID=2777186 RepID=UPI001A904D6E|nr:SGNH/GDSL hydrolase family protein [Psychroflexus sp. ALD_RP9]QSS96233.1 G-D-S-L family lipolytic protein [Psychroflexus sp. ALD_RP9]
MKNYIKYIGISACAALMSCEPEFDNSIADNEVYRNGEADFTNFVSVGNSLTAGYADNALYVQGQENSFPNILAQQFELVGGGEFIQPLMADNLGGLKFNGQIISGNRLVLTALSGSPAPAPIAGEPSTEVTNKLSGPINNMGVPGAKSYHLVAEGYGSTAGVPLGESNPYFARFSSSDNATVLGDAVAQNPSFFSLWIGNNDILGFATSGGVGVNQLGNLDPSTYGSNDITDPNVFASVYSQLIDGLSANASGGVVFNIPDVTNIPFFTTVPVNAIPLDQATADLLNSQFVAYNNQILPGLAQMGVISVQEAQQRQVNFVAGQNFVTIQDENLTDISSILQGPPFNLDAQTAATLGQVRQATEDDLIPLTASSILGTTVNNNPTLINGVSVPLGDQYVLTVAEQEMVSEAQQAYNSTIEALAEANNLAFVDVDQVLVEVSNGIGFDGGVLTSDFVTGGAFSLDGVHLTSRGYAYVANQAIMAINAQYGSTLPMVNIGDYGTVNLSDNIAQ